MLEFNEDNGSYEQWIAVSPNQFVINAERSLNPDNMVLHRANCHTINGTPVRGTTWIGDYIKICGTQRELEARYTTARPCGVCMR